MCKDSYGCVRMAGDTIVKNLLAQKNASKLLPGMPGTMAA